MKNMTRHLCYKLFIFLLFINILSSCSEDESTNIKKQYLITEVAMVDETRSDFDGVDNVWEYEYDEDDKLVIVSQYNPRNTLYKIENLLIYDSNNELIKIKVIQEANQRQDEYLITHEEGKVSLYGMGNDIKNYYYNSDRFVTKTEDVFIGRNTNFKNYSRNNSNQLTKIESGTDGVTQHTRLFMDFDTSDPFQFHDLFPTQDFIIMYAFNLKYNGLGKPSSWDYGYFEYDVDNNGSVSEFKTFIDFDNVVEYGGGMRFKYKEK